MEKDEGKAFIIDTTKISDSKAAESSRKGTIEQILAGLEHRKPFGVGDMVTILKGPYAHIGLMVVEKKEHGKVQVAPAPNTPTVEMDEADLYHFDDYHEAFKVALVEEQILNPDKPQ